MTLKKIIFIGMMTIAMVYAVVHYFKPQNSSLASSPMQTKIQPKPLATNNSLSAHAPNTSSIEYKQLSASKSSSTFKTPATQLTEPHQTFNTKTAQNSEQGESLSGKLLTKQQRQVLANLSAFLDEASQQVGETSDILSANDEATQIHLLAFAKKIATDVLDNQALDNQSKQQVLWQLYANRNWRKKNRGFKASITDALLGMDLSHILPEIAQAYRQQNQTINMHPDEQSIKKATELLQFIGNNFDNNQSLVNDVYLTQIQRPQSSQETQELALYALSNYLRHNQSTEISNHLQDIMASIEADQYKAHMMMDELLVAAVNHPDITKVVFHQLFTQPLGVFSKDGLHNALLFELEVDRNFNIADIPQDGLRSVKHYLEKEGLQQGEWKKVHDRIDHHLQ